MPSRSPSRRSSSISSHSIASSNRSPNFVMHGNSRRGRSPPADFQHRRRIADLGRRRILSRGASSRSNDGSMRGQRSGELRHTPRSAPSGSYSRGQYATAQHSPRRVAPTGVKTHSFSSLPVVPSTSGLKRKYIPRPSSSSSSSPSPLRTQHQHMQPLKKKKLAMERRATSREPHVTMPVRKHSRSKSPIRERGIHSRSSSHYGVRDEDGGFDGGSMSKGSGYSAIGSSSDARVVADRGYATSPRRRENPQKRYMAEPVVRYSGEGGGRPIFRGPEKTESTSYSDRELKQIKVGIRQKVPVEEPEISRKIVNPEDIVVVRRPDGSLVAIGVQADIDEMVTVRTDSREILEALCEVPWTKGDLLGHIFGKEDFQSANIIGCEGSRPIFEREELREALNSADDAENKCVEQERRSRHHYQSEDCRRVVASHQQLPEEREVSHTDGDEPTKMAASSLHHSLRAHSHRSHSPPPSSSRSGNSRFKSISPHPLPSMERQGRRGDSRPLYYNTSPSPPPRIASAFGRGRTRGYSQASTSHALPGTSSQPRHKEGRRSEDLRYELEYRRCDDSSYERGNNELRTDSDGASSDLRMRINEKRTSDHRVAHYAAGEGAHVIHSKVVSERGYSTDHHRGDEFHEQRQRGAERSGGHHAVGPTQHEAMDPEVLQSRGSFHNKSSSSSIQSWDGNPEYVPKGRAYYEHDNRDEEWVRMGGGGGGLRRGRGGRFAGAMGVRGRPFRGYYNPGGRGWGRGGGGRGYPGSGGIGRGYTRGGGIRRPVNRGAASMGGSSSYSRGRSTSPSLWKHDMFENLSSDENRPTSSTGDMKR